MALARIITRSDACSRELAFDLLGRGYTVEIVTPDAVPATLADLELRVETGAGDKLTASVIARDGERSASLEFVRQLKAAALEPALTLPAAVERARLSAPPSTDSVQGNSAQGGSAQELSAQADPVPCDTVRNAKETELPVETPSIGISSTPIEIMLTPDSDAGRDSKGNPGGAQHAGTPVNQLPSLVEQPPVSFASASSMITRSISGPTMTRPVVARPMIAGPTITAPASQPLISLLPPTDQRAIVTPAVPLAKALPAMARPIKKQSADIDFPFPHKVLDRSPSLLGTVAVTITTMALVLTLAFGFSLRHTNAVAPKAQDRISSSNPGPAAVTGISLPTAVAPGKEAVKRLGGKTPLAATPAAAKPEANSDPAAKPPAVPKVVVQVQGEDHRSVNAAPPSRNSRGREEGIIARDTVTYLDRPVKQAVAEKLPTPRPHSSERRNGVIAENTVTYVNGSSGNSIHSSSGAAK